MVADDDLDAQGSGAGADDVDGLGMAGLGDEDGAAVVLAFEAVAHGHGFGGGGAFVEQRGVGDVQAGEVGDHGLEIEQGFEAALGDFGLVRGVLGVPAGVFEDVALDDRRA